MPNREFYSDAGAALALSAATRTADANGSSIDLRDYDSVLIVGVVGASGDTLSGSVYAEFEVEESDDASTWTDVADADLTNYVDGTNAGTFAVIDDAAEDDAIYMTSYIGDARYIRVVYNITGTHTNGMPSSAFVVRGHASRRPVNS